MPSISKLKQKNSLFIADIFNGEAKHTGLFLNLAISKQDKHNYAKLHNGEAK
jgi:hypothetical protein